MKLFITGATGFIGSHLVNQALAAGNEVLALRHSSQSLPRIPLAKAPDWLDKSLTQVQSTDLVGTDCLIHLAAHSANVPYDTLENCMLYNVMEPLKLFRTAVAAGVKHFIVAGSCFEYGKSGERYEYIPVDAPLEPTQSYPASKAAFSTAMHAFAAEHNVCVQIHRIFQVFGEGELSTRFWPSLRRAALAGEDFNMTAGEQVRDFIDVREVAARFLAYSSPEQLAAIDPGKVALHNLGSGASQSLRIFAEYWWKQWNAKGTLHFGLVPYRSGEVMRYVPEGGR